MDDVSTKPALKRNPVRGDFQPFIADTRNWSGHRECHILPDWLLIYHIVIYSEIKTVALYPHS